MISTAEVGSIFLGSRTASVGLAVAALLGFVLVAEVWRRRRLNRLRGVRAATDRLLRKLAEAREQFTEKAGGQPVLWGIGGVVRNYLSSVAGVEFGKTLDADTEKLFATDDPRLLAVLKEVLTLEAISTARHAPTLHDGNVAIDRLEAALDRYLEGTSPDAPQTLGLDHVEYEKHREYVVQRSKEHDFRVVEKLQRIDDFADLIFTARRDPQVKKRLYEG